MSTIDFSKPLQIRLGDGRTVRVKRVISHFGPAPTPVVVVAENWNGHGDETLWLFRECGSSLYLDAQLENSPEPKVTEVHLWKTTAGGFYANSPSPAVPLNWTRIGALRITEAEGQPPKVEVVE